jgi:hypothetical protein
MDLSSSGGVKERLFRRTTTLRGRDLNVASPRLAAGAYPLTVLLKSTWITYYEAV